MDNQAQVDALEHLLMAVLRSNSMLAEGFKAFERAHISLVDSEGPAGAQEKSAAVNYLNHLKQQL